MNTSLVFDDFFVAYKKLKMEIYYNTVNLHQRKEIADFEALNETNDAISTLFASFANDKDSENYCFKKLKKLFDAFCERTKENDSYLESLFQKIEVFHLPKSILRTDDSSNSSMHEPTEKYTIDKAKDFIRMPIELHVIEVLWAMIFGGRFQKTLTDHCLGNRLLLNKEGNVKEDGALFVPYFKQYKKWRDGGIQAAINQHADGRNVSIINLDIKDCFDSIWLQSEDIQIKDPGDSGHKLVQDLFIRILTTYTRKRAVVRTTENRDGFFCLPIGLLSSGVLCNWYLASLDGDILEKVNPVYYSRYVDDISIVIIDDGHSSPETKPNILRIFKDVVSSVGEEILTTNQPDLRLNMKKSTVFHYPRNGSAGVLRKYMLEMAKQTSESRIITDDSELNDSLLESIYSVSLGRDVNKLVGIKDVTATRLGISVYLTKAIEAKKNGLSIGPDQIAELASLLQGSNIIEHYQLWEKIFTLLVLNKDADTFVTFYERICKEIHRMIFPANIEGLGAVIKKNTFENLLVCIELATALDFPFMEKNRKKFEITSNKEYIHHFFLEHRYQSFDISRYNNYIPVFIKSNMIRHSYLKRPLVAYSTTKDYYKNSLISKSSGLNSAVNLDLTSLLLSPRRMKLFELVMFLTTGQIAIGELTNELVINKGGFIKQALYLYFLANYKVYAQRFFEDTEKQVSRYIDDSYFDSTLEKIFSTSDTDGSSSDTVIRRLSFSGSPKGTPRVGVANMQISESDIVDRIRDTPPLPKTNFGKVLKVLAASDESECDILVYPECSVNFGDIEALSEYACRRNRVIVFGTEHLNVSSVVYNFIVCLVPVRINGSSDLIPIIRLKNHYSPGETEQIEGFHNTIPVHKKSLYHLINWSNIYFSTYYCFELANIEHRALFRSKVDLIIASEWNKDTNYFSNIVESTCRDVHAFFAQVNTSQYGDSRITRPSKTESMDLIRIKGGKEALLISDVLDIDRLRKFQLMNYTLQSKQTDGFKPTPPNFDHDNVRKRIRNE